MFGPLRHRNFLLLWSGHALSTIGDRMVTVALALWVVEETGSASDLALLLAANTAPLVGLVLVGGIWADRLPRQRIMVATDVARFALQGLLAALIATGNASIPAAMVVLALVGANEAFFRPAYSGLLPQTVPEDEIQEANAATVASENVAELVGPALSTVLVLALGPAFAFGFDAMTFLVSAILLAFVRPRPRGDPQPRESLLRELSAGWREFRSRTWVWATVAAFCVALFAAFAPFFVLGPLIAREEWGSAGYYGVALAVLGAGTVCGALIALRVKPRRPLLAATVLATIWPVALLVYAVGAPLPVVFATLLAGGAGVSLFDVWWTTALAEHIPPQALSRVSSYDWMGSLALLPLGFVAAGLLADEFGAGTVLAAGSAASAVVLTLPLLSPSLRRLGRGRAAPTVIEPSRHHL